jgi:hypothetical protein
LLASGSSVGSSSSSGTGRTYTVEARLLAIPNLKPVLKWANIILGSLGRIVSLGVLDPIKEFKEAGETAAEDAYESEEQ